MREIKFRGWWRHRDGSAHELIEDINDRPISDLNEAHFIIEQFTGLLDNNGKEIYEGDVLSINVGGGEVYTAPVRFSEDGFWGVDVYEATQVSNPYKWKYKHDKIKSHGFRLNMVEPLTSLQCLVYEAPNTRKDWQIIGNIHEDKHLLEQRKGE